MAELLNDPDEASRRTLEKRLALPGYVEELSRAPWIWGETDCTMAVATWIERITGIDPLAQYRGRYHSASDARRVATVAGGFLSALGEHFSAAGLERTESFETGDVAAVNASLYERFVVPVVGCVLAIRMGSYWVVKARIGVIARAYPLIQGWRL